MFIAYNASMQTTMLYKILKNRILLAICKSVVLFELSPVKPSFAALICKDQYPRVLEMLHVFHRPRNS